MPYRINLFERDRLTSTELMNDCPLEEAKDYAVKAVVTGQADRAEVRSINGRILFQHPLKHDA